MVNDRLSDVVARIKNGYQAGKNTMEMPWSRSTFEMAKVLVNEGYLESVEKEKNSMVIGLKYAKQKPVLRGITRISKPGARIYSGIKKLKRVGGGVGVNILSTPKGILSEKVARKLNVGGEVIAQVW